MKNIPRIFISDKLSTGIQTEISRETYHYLTHVMRTDRCLVFNSGQEFFAHISSDGRHLILEDSTNRPDPSNDITLYFAPIKRTDDLINMATQMGVGRFVPVITERTVANHINWDRMAKIATESSEQSNRNSVPSIAKPIYFSDLDLSQITFADERHAYGIIKPNSKEITKNLFIGPEGGFSQTEFASFDASGAYGLNLGSTILRAELAAPIAVAHILMGLK